ncbi:MAG: glycosyltransferase involved in cell wall biosynthesis [Planctomycetota bacterium]
MKILFGIDTWGLVGGTERYATVVVPALTAKGHEVSVLCRHEPESGFLSEHVHAVLHEPALGEAGLSRSQAFDLAARVKELAPDVIYLQALRNVDALDALVDVAPLVRYVHDHTLFCPGLNKYHENGNLCKVPMGSDCLDYYYLKGGCICFKQIQHKNRITEPLKIIRDRMREIESTLKVSHVLTNSEYMRDELLRVGFAPEKTSVLYYFTQSGTDAQPMGDLPEATQAFLDASDAPLVFTPARLTLPDKGVDFLLTALAQLKGEYRAVIAGSGPVEDYLRQKAIDEGLGDRVHFTGWLNSPGMETLYSRADVVVCPSVWNEPFGLIGIESYCHSKPVVAFGVGGIPEWLDDGETGFLIERMNTGAMAEAIDKLIADPELAKQFGKTGRTKRDTEFGYERHMQTLEQLLLEAAQ